MTRAVSLPILSPQTETDRKRNRNVFVIAVLIFSGLCIWNAIASYCDIETDATMHYMIARFALSDPVHMTSVWGRPLCTLAYAVPAVLGRQVGARLMSLLMALVIAGVSYSIASRQKMRFPALAVVLLFAQPLFFFHSWSSLTEIPFAMALSLAFWAYQRRWWVAMAIFAGLTPLGRLEGFAFVLIAIVALLLHRKWWIAPLVVVPFLLWSYEGYVANSRPWNYPWWQWVFRNSPYSTESMYGRGPLWWFVGQLPMIVGPFATPFFMVGIWWCAKRAFAPTPGAAGESRYPAIIRWVLVPADQTARCDVWIALIPLMILILHSLLWWQGKLGSAGSIRYMVMVAPFWALVSARGVEWCAERFQFNRPLRWASVGALLPLLMNWHMYPGPAEFPFPRYAEDYIAKSVADWYLADPKVQADYPLIVSTPPAVWLHLDMNFSNSKRVGERGKQNILEPKPGTFLIWDPVYAVKNADESNTIPHAWVEQGHWIYVGRFDCSGSRAEIYLSPQTSSGDPTVWLKPPFQIDPSVLIE